MPKDEDSMDDDYVAKLLAEDAKKSSIKYAAAGLSALLPVKSTRSGPKPNTRFLNHLVRDVDSHNAALRKREQLETQTRIEGFRKSEREDERRRALDLAGGIRGRGKDEYARDSRHHRSKRDREQERPQNGEHRNERARSHKHADDDTEHRHKRRRRDSDSDAERRYERNKRDLKRTQDGSKSDRDTGRDSRRSRHDKSPINDSKSSSEPRKSFRDRDHHRSHHSRRRDSPSSNSDPLEDIVASLHPQPVSTEDEPIRIRGRGALNASTSKSKSNIDIHFSLTYNPSLDTQPDHDQDLDPNTDRSDWDMALEALRDRESYKKKQSDRMREAGFTSEEIEKWERGALNTSTSGIDVDRDIKEVKWKKRGEGREWDLGKKGFSDDNDDEEEEDDNGDDTRERHRKDHDRKRDDEKLDKDKDKDRRKRSTSHQEGWKGKNSGFMRSFRSALGS